MTNKIDDWISLSIHEENEELTKKIQNYIPLTPDDFGVNISQKDFERIYMAGWLRGHEEGWEDSCCK